MEEQEKLTHMKCERESSDESRRRYALERALDFFRGQKDIVIDELIEAAAEIEDFLKNGVDEDDKISQ